MSYLWFVSCCDKGDDDDDTTLLWSERKIFACREEAKMYLLEHAGRYNMEASEKDLQRWYRMVQIDTIKCPQWAIMYRERERSRIARVEEVRYPFQLNSGLRCI